MKKFLYALVLSCLFMVMGIVSNGNCDQAKAATPVQKWGRLSVKGGNKIGRAHV